MELDWSTFILEMVNFVILVWILKRFLYKPVLNVIEQRQAAINEKLQHAEAMKQEADVFLNDYTNRLSEWEKEKQGLKQALDQDIHQERVQRVRKLEDEIASQREKANVIEEREHAELQRQVESRAISMAARFAAKLFSDLSGPEVESRLIKLFVNELHSMSPERKRSLLAGGDNADDSVSVYTAYEVDPHDSEMLTSELQQLFGDGTTINYFQSSELIAGLKITYGAFVLQANLQDELNDFAHFSHDVSAL